MFTGLCYAFAIQSFCFGKKGWFGFCLFFFYCAVVVGNFKSYTITVPSRNRKGIRCGKTFTEYVTKSILG